MFLQDRKTRTSLSIGDIIVYDLEGGLISIGYNGNPKYLCSDDDKIFTGAVTKFMAIEIINLIESVTNTRIEMSDTSGQRGGPGYIFFEVKEVYEVPT